MKKILRDLTETERECLLCLLPERKKGYNAIRQGLKEYKIRGMLSDSSFIICKEGIEPEDDYIPDAVFAAGTIIFNDNTAEVTLSKISDDCAEFDISLVKESGEKFNIINSWSYSDWDPGNKAPGDNSEVKEILISEEHYILVLAPVHKKIWVHEMETGINYLIPVTNYYTNVMMVKGVRDPAKVLKPELFFQDLHTYSNEDLKNAFILYNRYFNKFNIPLSSAGEGLMKNNSIFKYFKRG